MNLLLILLVSAALLTAAYWSYGPVLTRLFRLDPAARTPADELRDDVDYVPIEPNALLSQHFSAIAAAGPIVGPILAGAMFGWLPALIWILVGSIFIGGVHDMTALVASIRHKARSIAEVVREHMSQRSYHAVPDVRLDRPGLHHRGVHRRHGGIVRRRGQNWKTGRSQRGGNRDFVADVPGAADRHGTAVALHEAVARPGRR